MARRSILQRELKEYTVENFFGLASDPDRVKLDLRHLTKATNISLKETYGKTYVEEANGTELLTATALPTASVHGSIMTAIGVNPTGLLHHGTLFQAVSVAGALATVDNVSGSAETVDNSASTMVRKGDKVLVFNQNGNKVVEDDGSNLLSRNMGIAYPDNRGGTQFAATSSGSGDLTGRWHYLYQYIRKSTAGQLFYSNISATAFTATETITGSVSGATATVSAINSNLKYIDVTGVVGSFQFGETITGGTSAATALVETEVVRVVSESSQNKEPVRYSWANSHVDVENNVISYSCGVTVTSATTISLSNIKAATDDQVTHIRLYRTRDVSKAGTDPTKYYFLKDIDEDATTATDTWDDTQHQQVGGAEEFQIWDHEPLPESLYGAAVLDRIYSAVTDNDRDIVRYTPGGLDQFDEIYHPAGLSFWTGQGEDLIEVKGGGWFKVSDDDFQKITGMIELNDELVVFKERKTAVLPEGNPANPVFFADSDIGIKIKNDVSMIKSVARFKKYLIGVCSDDTVRMFDGRQWGPSLSEDVKDEIETMFTPVGVFFKDKYFLFYKDASGDSYNDECLVLHFHDTKPLGWTKYDFINGESVIKHELGDEQNAGDFYKPQCWVLDGGDYKLYEIERGFKSKQAAGGTGGSNITCNWKHAPVKGPTPMYMLEHFQLNAFLDTQQGNVACTVSVDQGRVDRSLNLVPNYSVDSSMTNMIAYTDGNLDLVGKYLEYEFEVVADGNLVFQGFTLEAKPQYNAGPYFDPDGDRTMAAVRPLSAKQDYPTRTGATAYWKMHEGYFNGDGTLTDVDGVLRKKTKDYISTRDIETASFSTWSNDILNFYSGEGSTDTAAGGLVTLDATINPVTMDDFTVEFWMKNWSVGAGIDQADSLYILGNVTSNGGWQIRRNITGSATDYLEFFVKRYENPTSNSFVIETPVTQASLSGWQHFAFVYKRDDTAKSYINGVEVASEDEALDWPIGQSTETYLKFCHTADDTDPFSFDMRHCRIFAGTALSVSQILEDYNATRGELGV